ncbi:hypothetical protein L195_g045713, partial [Trifolium pratense]
MMEDLARFKDDEIMVENVASEEMLHEWWNSSLEPQQWS